MKFLGVDTDTRGSVALIDGDAKGITVYKMPASEQEINGSDRLRLDKQATALLFLRLIAKTRPDVIVYEQQWARPATGVGKDGKPKKTQGIASTFTFAETYGAIQGAIYSAVAHVRSTDEAYAPQIEAVSGRKWKNGFGLDSDKKKAVALATRLFPHAAGYWTKVKDTSAAEACLIAYYASVICRPAALKVNTFSALDICLLGFDPIPCNG